MSKKITLISIAAMLILAITLSGCGTKYALNIVTVGQGNVTPISGATYQAGTVVELKPTSADGYAFDHWGGPDGALVRADRILMDGNKYIAATFTKLKHELDVSIEPATAGTVDTVIVIPEKGLYDAEHGQTVRLIAKANPGYMFDHWDVGETANVKDIVMDGDKTATAHFVPVLTGRVLGIRTLEPLAGVTVSFSDGGTAVTDADGYWIKKYDPSSPPASPVTVAPVADGVNDIWETHTPSSVTVSWPVKEIIFALEGYRFTNMWGSEGAGDGQFNYPKGVEVDQAGNLFVVDYLNCRVQKFTSEGVFITKWGSFGDGDGQFRNPRGIAMDAEGNFYVTDASNNRIQKFTSEGVFITKWGSFGNGDGQFSQPYGLATDAEGNIYAVDAGNSRIQKFDSEGVFITKWGSSGLGEGQFYQPCGLATDGEGNIYVADGGGVDPRIQKFTNEGVFLTTWGHFGAGDGQFRDPRGMAADANGNIYVVDAGSNRVQKFTSEGVFLARWGYFGTGDGRFDNPQDITLDGLGNIYVADTFNHRVQKFEHLD